MTQFGVDRGGLQYTIEATNTSKPVIDAFTKDIAEARAEIARLKAELAGLTGGRRIRVSRTAAAGTAIDPQTREQVVGLNKELTRTPGLVNRISFTFRRLVGILAAFTLARRAIQGFNQLVTESIRFNAQIETSRLGIASLILAVGKVSDALGNTIDNAQALPLAIKEAQRQMDLLRSEGAKTAATFEQLVETFQTALAPGFQAGLDLDEIRRFAVSISQAAAAIALPQQQLAEEIRSILSGTVSARSTRIALALGITNDDIKNAKELGVLAEFLQRKFEAFRVAGEASTKTFDVLVQQVRNSVLLLLGDANFQFFDELKALLRDVLQLTRTIGSDGVLILNPQAQKVIEAIGEGLKEAVTQARFLIQDLSFDDAVGAATTFRDIISTSAVIVRGFISGFLKGLSSIRKAVASILQVLGRITGIKLFDTESLFATVQVLTKIATIYFAVRITLSAIVKLWTILTAVTKAAFVVARTLVTVYEALAFLTAAQAAAWLTVGGTLALIAAAIGGIALLLSGGDGIVEGVQKIAKGASSLLDRLLGLPGAISDAREPLRQNAELVKDFREELEKANDNLKEVVATLGLEGAALEQRRASLEAEAELRSKTQKLLEEEANANAKIAAVQKERADIESRISKLSPGTQKVAERVNNLVERALNLEQDRLATKNQILLKEEEIAKASREGDVFGAQRAREELDILIRGFDVAGDVISDFEKQIERVIENSFGTNQRSAERLKTLFIDRVRLLAQENNELNTLNDIQKDREDIERSISVILATRLQALAKESTFRLTNANAISEIELENATALLSARLKANDPRFLDEQKAALILAENESVLLAEQNRQRAEILNQSIEQLKIDQERRIAEAGLGNIAKQFEGTERIARLELEINDLLRIRDTLLEKRVNETDPAILASLDQQITNTNQQIVLVENLVAQEKLIAESVRQAAIEQELNNQKLQEAVDLANRFRDAIARPVESGLIDGLVSAAQELPSLYEGVFDTVRDTVNSFVDFASDAIVDAFDPTKKVDLKERFRIFLQDIARQIIRTLISVAIQALILNALVPGFLTLFGGIGAGAGAAGGGGFGFRKGGRVGKAFGMAEGGPVPNRPAPAHRRPRGLHPSDRVPIWADPREFVVSAPAVAAFGEDFLNGVNQLRLNPFSHRALAGMDRSPSSPRIRASRGPGFAAGGQVGSASLPSGSFDAAQPVPAYIVPSDQAADRFLRGGRNAVLRFMQENGFVKGRSAR